VSIPFSPPRNLKKDDIPADDIETAPQGQGSSQEPLYSLRVPSLTVGLGPGGGEPMLKL